MNTENEKKIRLLKEELVRVGVENKRLREIEKLYKRFIENDNVIFFSCDKTRKFTYITPSVVRYIGFTPDEIIGKHFLELIYPPDQKHVMAEYESLLAGDHQTRQYRVVKKDKTSLWVRSMSRMFFENNRFAGFAGVIFDIQDRMDAIAALEKSKTHYRRIFENIQDVYYETSLDGRIIEVSPSIETISKYRRNELIGQSILELYDNIGDREKLIAALQKDGKFKNSKVFMKDKDGRILTFLLSACLHRDGAGTAEKIVGSLKDITDMAAMEKQLQQALKMELLGTLSGGIAHDFNNILYAILGYTELCIAEAEPDSRMAENLKRILTSANRASDLIKQILAFSRQEESDMGPVYLKPLVMEVAGLMRATLRANIEIKKSVNTRLQVMGNITRLHQVLINLCINASYAMRETGGRLFLTVDEVLLKTDAPGPEKYARITVSDTGCGMAPMVCERIFEPFFTTKPQGEGTGLGLSTVYGIVRDHGGKITVESTPGKGSKFIILLPVLENKTAAAPIQGKKQGLSGTERILFIDDEEPIASLAELMLTRYGYRVDSQTKSANALESFRAAPNTFDLVITDMNMPEMTGIELSRELLHIRPDIPIILCTGFSRDVDAKDVKQYGIRAIAMKPVVVDGLCRIIRDVMDRKQQAGDSCSPVMPGPAG